MPNPTTLPAWGALQSHFAGLAGAHMRELFAADPVLADIYLPSGAWQMLGSRISLSLPTAGVRYDLPPFRAVQFRPS